MKELITLNNNDDDDDSGVTNNSITSSFTFSSKGTLKISFLNLL